MIPSTPTCSITLLDTGACLGFEALAVRGGRWRLLEWRALATLIAHPQHGYLLFDTGYAPRMLDATQRWPARLYRLLTPLRLTAAQSVVAQLQRHGIDPHEVGTIIVSHFHADHIAGLRDFPYTRLVASRAAYHDFVARRGLSGLRRGYLRALLPLDFAQRVQLIDSFDDQVLGALGPCHDLYGDELLRLVRLPGHARGQLGLLVQTARGLVLLAADGAWLSRAYREQRSPSRLVRWLSDEPQAAQDTLRKLHAFAAAHPEVLIVPTHCPELLPLIGRRL